MHHDLCDLESQIQIRILPKERTLKSWNVFCVLHLQRTRRHLKAQHEIITWAFVLEGLVLMTQHIWSTILFLP